ncbi:hypothetical protein FN846DRAFT_550090 [Sphaerosporella brunnea]|nr:hypothetical protein FN846DRAFT_550090 [Sphaerosporella brunnea]
MANCEFYANIYTEALNVYFRTPSTAIAWVERLESALPQFYAAILVFAVKAKRYFTPSTRGKFTNPLKPFATTLQTYLNNIDETERALKELAGMATMQGVKDLRDNTLNMVGEMRGLFTEISDDKAKQWLKAVNPDPMYDFNKERRLEGTCEWIFKNERYNTWINGDGNRDLWVVGIPGAGKSVLATNLVDNLRKSGVVVLFFFFRDGDDRTTSPLEMVASIIAQLTNSGIDRERLMRILKLRMESSSYFTNDVSEPRDFKKLCATLIEMLQGYAAKVIILLDALDECSNPKDVATHLIKPSLDPSTITSQMMLPGIGELIDVRFLLTGRPVVHDIFASLPNVSTIDMDVNDDIRRFVTESVADNESLRLHKEKIIATIYENSAGMFRYAALVLEELNEPSPVEISKRLQTMPKGISGMYELILRRLGSKGSDWDLEMRRRLLMWVTMAFRPVTVAEMQYACVVVDGYKSFDPDQVVLPSEKQMLTCCGSLLEVFDGNKLRFTHRTVKEFLLQPLEKLSEVARPDKRVTRCMVVHEGEAHASMAVTCVTQLFSKDLSGVPFCYAVQEWLKHAKAVPRGRDATSLSQTLWKLVADVFWDRDTTFREWRRVYRPDHDGFHKKQNSSTSSALRCLHPRFTHGTTCTGQHVAASYGLVDNIDWAHPERIDFNERDGERWTPLIHAAHAGEEEAVMAILTKEGVDINSANNFGRTALIVASDNRPKGIIEILLRQAGIEVDHISKQGHSALGYALYNEDQKVIEMLKQKGATVAKYGWKDLAIGGFDPR